MHLRKLIQKLIHVYYKLRHYFRKPDKAAPRPKMLKRREVKALMQQQVDLDTATELARQWDTEDVKCPPHRRPK